MNPKPSKSDAWRLTDQDLPSPEVLIRAPMLQGMESNPVFRLLKLRARSRRSIFPRPVRIVLDGLFIGYFVLLLIDLVVLPGSFAIGLLILVLLYPMGEKAFGWLRASRPRPHSETQFGLREAVVADLDHAGVTPESFATGLWWSLADANKPSPFATGRLLVIASVLVAVSGAFPTAGFLACMLIVFVGWTLGASPFSPYLSAITAKALLSHGRSSRARLSDYYDPGSAALIVFPIFAVALYLDSHYLTLPWPVRIALFLVLFVLSFTAGIHSGKKARREIDRNFTELLRSAERLLLEITSRYTENPCETNKFSTLSRLR